MISSRIQTAHNSTRPPQLFHLFLSSDSEINAPFDNWHMRNRYPVSPNSVMYTGLLAERLFQQENK